MVVKENGDQCFFCNIKKAIHYCEECNLSFCEDCGFNNSRTIYVCMHCKGNNIEYRQTNSVNEELYVCKNCGSLDIEAKLIIHRNCPSCHSPRIISIIKKKLILIKQLRDAISGFKFGYQELKEFLREYRAVRQKTIALRAVGYLHDQVIEQTLLSVYDTIKLISNEIFERAKQEIDLLQIQMGKFNNYSQWTAKDFPEIDLLIKQIYEDAVQYQNYVQKILFQPKKEQGLVQSKLKVIRYYKSIYDEYSEHLNLFPGELPVCAFREIKFFKSTIQGLKTGKGILFLTDQRLIFIRKSGIIRKKFQRIFNFTYNHILNVSINGRYFKKLNFILDQGNLIFSASKRMMEAILDYLNISVNFGKYRINDGKVLNTLEQIQLSTKNLENEINRKIIELIAGTSEARRINYLIQKNVNTEINNKKNDNIEENYPISNINRMILNLQTKKLSTEKTIQNLEQKFNLGGLDAEIYLKQYNNLQSELLIIENKLQILQNQLQYNF
ncbi:MAG: hypothetical protein ACFFD2_03755 [Promethearchaeota archaeon]